MKKETVIDILDKYIKDYDDIIADKASTRIQKSIAESYKAVVENIKGDVVNAEENN